jgi:proton glutamate symport protein
LSDPSADEVIARPPSTGARRVLAGLVAGLVVGWVLAAVGGGASDVANSILAPIGTLWINAVRMTVVPLVVSLLFVSVATAGGGRTIARESVVAFSVFTVLLTMAALVAWLLVPAAIDDMPFTQEAGEALRASAQSTAAATTGAVKGLPPFSQWVTTIVPTNVMKTAVDSAMLPLVVFVLLFASAARAIDASGRSALVSFFSTIGAAMTVVVRWVIAVAPIGVFALVVGPASRGGGSLAGALGYYVMASCFLTTLFTLLMYPVSAIGGVPFRVFVRAAFPPQAVAFASSSSLASLPALIESARRMGIPDRVAGFSLPLAVSTFKVATPIVWVLATSFLARLYGVELTMGTLAFMCVSSIVLSFGIPGVPNGGLLMMAAFATNFGIPPEGVGLLLAVDTIPDLFATVTNVTGDLVATTVVDRFADTSDGPVPG